MRIIGLDVGEKRIGVAKGDSSTRIAVPVGFVNVDGSEWRRLARIATMQGTNFFVLGLPRSNEGTETQQSVYVRNFAKNLVQQIPGAKVRFQDESLTSVVAEERLKSRKRTYEKGEIDAEAATIILQDFLESYTPTNTSNTETENEKNVDEGAMGVVVGVKSAVADAKDTAANLTKKEADKVKLNAKKAKHKMKTTTKTVSILLGVFVFVLLIGGGVFLWGKMMLGPVVGNCQSEGTTVENCTNIAFTVTEGESKSIIADNLEQAGLIKNAWVFKLHLQMSWPDVNFKSGVYHLNKDMTADEIIAALERGAGDTVFNFTIRPGETIFDIKYNLASLGYSTTEIDQAFNASYDFDFLKKRPNGATLEGYLYGETYEFYREASVRDILQKYLEKMGEVITDNNLEARYEAQGLSLHEGITLASMIQKEANPADMPTVAQVFMTRMNEGMLLGSDVTVSYALDVVDPNRQFYGDNIAAVEVESCYNTRKYAGLPCGPISNPGISALTAVAEPSDTSYLYFLTGDDGLMYYSYTETEHLQNAAVHCQNLCSISL